MSTTKQTSAPRTSRWPLVMHLVCVLCWAGSFNLALTSTMMPLYYIVPLGVAMVHLCAIDKRWRGIWIVCHGLLMMFLIVAAVVGPWGNRKDLSHQQKIEHERRDEAP